jgi:O-antigen ligase
VLLAVAAVVCVVTVPTVAPDASVSRALSVLTVSGSDVSSNGRTQLWSHALDEFDREPFVGIGTGGFAATQTAGQYPHNLFLEPAAELGLVGLALVLLLVVEVGIRLVRAWRAGGEEERLVSGLVLALGATALVNATFSGGLPHNRAVWLWAGVALGLSARVLAEARELPEGATVWRPRWRLLTE